MDDGVGPANLSPFNICSCAWNFDKNNYGLLPSSLFLRNSLDGTQRLLRELKYVHTLALALSKCLLQCWRSLQLLSFGYYHCLSGFSDG